MSETKLQEEKEHLSRNKQFSRDMHSYGFDKYSFVDKFTFMLTRAQLQFKDPSREIGRLLNNRLSNVRLKLVIK